MDCTQAKIIRLIDDNRDRILSFARDIYAHGELGYKEFRTARRFTDEVKQLGLPTQEGLAITGVKATLNEANKDNFTLALIGELDALRIPNHAQYNPETEGAHCCGHNCQLAGVLGAAIALSDPEVARALDGRVVFFAVPAEEYGEIDFKNQLKEAGKIRYGGGKCELIRIGAFDDIDMSITNHTELGNQVTLRNVASNGFVSKVIRYHGKAAHAAESPHLGVNALNAASLGLSALHYQRETFRDDDHVRIHAIMTRGGDLVNVVPEDVVLEALVRAGNRDALEDAAAKTDRAFFAGGAALGAQVEIETLPGYLPRLLQDIPPELISAAQLAAGDRYPVDVRDDSAHPEASSTDVGDLQHVSPTLTFYSGGATGAFHGSNFDIADEELAIIVTAKIFALSAYHFLKNGAAGAKSFVAAHPSPFTKQAYVDYMESMMKVERRP